MATRGVIQLPQGFETKYLARTKDPFTSLIAAQKAAKASAKAIEKVATLMMDGKARIDEEMWSECWHRLGYQRSQDTIEHARLALSEVGLLLFTGNTRKTQFRTPAREWIWCGVDGTEGLYEAFKKGYNPLGPND
jgi:hypothetical protein